MPLSVVRYLKKKRFIKLRTKRFMHVKILFNVWQIFCKNIANSLYLVRFLSYGVPQRSVFEPIWFPLLIVTQQNVKTASCDKCYA